MARFAAALFALGLLVPAFSAATDAPEDPIVREIEDTVLAGVAGWNRGDLESFMAPYWQSDTLRFASGGSVSYGWQTVLDRYRNRYPDRKTMGRLTFSELDVRLLAEDAALAFGRWTLEREEDRPTGLFTLVLERMPEGWRIVHDHTSSAE
jgi:ketosteroid isomerase-like protein